MSNNGKGQVRLVYLVPSGLIGYNTELMSMTKGYVIYNHSFEKYLPVLSGNVGGENAAFSFQWKRAKQALTGLCRWKTGGRYLLNRVRKYMPG